MTRVGGVATHSRSLGLPLRCPTCPPKHYFGTLKAETVPTSLVKYGKADLCPNCSTQLEAASRGERR